MNMNDYLKKRMLFFFLSVMIITLVTVTSTYAIMNSDFNKDSYLVIKNKNIVVTYLNNGSTLNMIGVPLSINDGGSAPSNVVKITNKSSHDTSYKITLTETNNNNFDLSKLYYSVDGYTDRLPSNGEIMINELEANFEHIYDIRIWLGSDLITTTDLGKQLTFNLNVTEIE